MNDSQRYFGVKLIDHFVTDFGLRLSVVEYFYLREQLFEDASVREIKALLEWIDKTEEGSRTELNFIPKETSWEKIASEADLCLRAKCNYYSDCFF